MGELDKKRAVNERSRIRPLASLAPVPVAMALVVTALVVMTGRPVAAEAVNPVESAAWADVREAFFGDSPVRFDDAVTILMADVIENSHDVPIALKLSPDLDDVREVVLIAENNPIQHVARIIPHRPLSQIGLKMRLELSTPIRAAALTGDGVWHVASKWVKVLTPGGCSVPAPRDVEAKEIDRTGEIAMRTFDRPEAETRLKFRIIHPMETGFAVKPDGETIPAYYLEDITIADGEGPVVEVVTQAAMAADPIITLDVPTLKQSLRIHARDSKGLEFEAQKDDPSDM